MNWPRWNEEEERQQQHQPSRPPSPAQNDGDGSSVGDLGKTGLSPDDDLSPDQQTEESDVLQQLVRLYRDQAPPPEPTADHWQRTFERIEIDLSTSRPPQLMGGGHRGRQTFSPRLRFFLGVLAAAMLGGVLLGRLLLWPTWQGAGSQDDEVFPVVSAAEIDIERMENALDADRLVLDAPVIGSIDFATTTDIDIVQAAADPEEGNLPRLARGMGVPMIVVVRADDEEP